MTLVQCSVPACNLDHPLHMPFVDGRLRPLPPLVPESVVDYDIKKRRPVAAGRFGDGGSDVVRVR